MESDQWTVPGLRNVHLTETNEREEGGRGHKEGRDPFPGVEGAPAQKGHDLEFTHQIHKHSVKVTKGRVRHRQR